VKHVVKLRQDDQMTVCI